MCGRLSEFSSKERGFEVDHIQPLRADGGIGEDVDSNCQLLCPKCHAKKTAIDLGYTFREKIRTQFDAQGRVVW